MNMFTAFYLHFLLIQDFRILGLQQELKDVILLFCKGERKNGRSSN